MNLDGPRLAVTLLTVIPVRRMVSPTRRAAGAAMLWAPAVGAVLAAIAAAVLYAGRWLDGPGTGAALAIAALAALTRGLHLDGLADLADGLGSGRDPAGALEVMRKSDIGPFGVVTLVLTLLIQVAALDHAAQRDPVRAVTVLIAAVITGRLAITWACRAGVPAARRGAPGTAGLGAMVAGTVSTRAAVWLTAALLAAGAAASSAGVLRPAVPAGAAAGLIAAWLLRRHAIRRLGGITGDVLGALAETATTVCLIVAAAR
jgi:adenosylcobinamide-GDP ribazoletransferase